MGMRFIDVSPQANGLAKNRGQSSAAKHSYITRAGQYARHDDPAIATGSVGMPAFAARDPAAYWSACDTYERANATLGIEYVFPLPAGLTDEQLARFCERYARRVSKFGGGDGAYPVTWALHPGHGSNPHMHLLVSERVVDERSAALLPGEFFKRANSQNPAAGGATKGNVLFGGLDEIKRDYVAMANRWSAGNNLDQRFVTGRLESQRTEARAAAAAAFKARDRAAWADAKWWEAKTYRPVTSHRGQAAERGNTENAADRLQKFRAEKHNRDSFLEEAAAICEAGFIKNGVPVPAECAEFAARYRAKFPEEFPELNNDLAAVLAQPAPASPKKKPAILPARPKEKIMQTQKPTARPKSGRIRRAPPPDVRDSKFATDFKASLFKKMYGAEISDDAAFFLSYVYVDKRTFRLLDGNMIADRGNMLTATQFTDMTIPVLVEQAKAKGWHKVEIEGGTDATIAAFKAAGIEVVNTPAPEPPAADDEDFVAKMLSRPRPTTPPPVLPADQLTQRRQQKPARSEKKEAPTWPKM